jgi:uncharacterized RDD family membrane protein YckC
MTYPSLLRRYLATLIDLVAMLFLLYLFAHSPLYNEKAGVAVMWPMWLFVLYEPVCNRYFTTLGQLLMRFRVRTIRDQRRVPLWRGVVRVLTKYLLGALSFIRMPVQKQKRALHDIISGTIALDARSVS